MQIPAENSKIAIFLPETGLKREKKRFHLANGESMQYYFHANSNARKALHA